MNMLSQTPNKTSVSDSAPSAFDYALAESLARRACLQTPWLHEVIAQLSSAVQQGHSCLPLDVLLDNINEVAPQDQSIPVNVEQLRKQLFASGLVGDPDSQSPLISDGTRLYLRRYFAYEQRVAEDLLRRAGDFSVALDAATLRTQIELFFPSMSATAPNWQRIAAVLALRQNLTLILGGPGSGKTWTVLRLLALIAQQTAQSSRVDTTEISQHAEVLPLRIALAAPTGKAAMRVTESLQRDLANLPVTEAMRASLPREATTLHRLLRMRPHSNTSGFDEDNPLPLDVLVLDEASMIDLPTMARVLAALPKQARLILLGDPDQLASIEIGNVLSELRAFNPHNRYSPRAAEIIAAATGAAPECSAETTSPFGDAIVTLTHSHRFAAGGGIARLVEAVRDGDTDRACEILRGGNSIVWHELDHTEAMKQTLQISAQRYASLQDANSVENGLDALANFRVLGALREGPWGTRALNAAIARAQLGINAWQPLPAHFSGAPLLITENDHALRLYNGDSGIFLADAQGRMRAWFLDSTHGVRALAPTQLPAFELGYAMTVHKAQGSEYASVLVLLPPQMHALLTREWLYTALSRARDELVLVGSEAVLRAAISNPAQRWSGLAAQITGLMDAADISSVTSA